MVLYKAGVYEEGVLLAEQALKMAKNDFGTNRLNLAQSQDNLAQLYSAQAHYAKAVENLYCLRRSLKVGQLTPTSTPW